MTRARRGSADGMRQAALWGESAKPGAANRLVQGDNLHVMRALPDECVDLIYIDPPFFSGRRHRPEQGDTRAAAGFSDIWTGGLRGYLVWLSARLYEMRRLLRPAGTIWLHLDWHAVHYVKIEADRLFGYGSFRNQVIWAYGATARGAKAVSGQLPRNHDIILVYDRGAKPVYHPVFSERLIPLAAIGRAGYRIDEQGRVFKTAPRGDYTDASIARLEREGRVHRTRTGSVRVKYFLERRGEYVVERRMLGDVWTAIPDAMHLGRERLGYPTQKPEALLETIIRCGTNPGDVVADFFCGSGTTAAVAQRLGRRWVACDDSAEAIALTVARLERLAAVEHGPLTAPAFSVEHLARAADV